MRMDPLETLVAAMLIKLFSNFVKSKDLVERYTKPNFSSLYRT
jgi:hypothetical protein